MISLERMADIVGLIMESADEVSKKVDCDSQDYGQLLAYAETLSIIRDMMDDEELHKIGLDFDIDARYLYGNR